jgi:hypothetical protein
LATTARRSESLGRRPCRCRAGEFHLLAHHLIYEIRPRTRRRDWGGDAARRQSRSAGRVAGGRVHERAKLTDRVPGGRQDVPRVGEVAAKAQRAAVRHTSVSSYRSARHRGHIGRGLELSGGQAGRPRMNKAAWSPREGRNSAAGHEGDGHGPVVSGVGGGQAPCRARSSRGLPGRVGGSRSVSADQTSSSELGTRVA